MAEKTKDIRNIGINVIPPKDTCQDNNCPFHGNLSVRGKQFVGTIVKSKMQKSAVVEWERRRYDAKYERYEKRKTKIKVHNPPCINAKEGDFVRIVETRPLSKSKHTVIIEIVGRDKQYFSRKDAEEESLTIHKKTEVKKV